MFKSLSCLVDLSDLRLKGSTNEVEGRVITVTVKTCSGHDYCRSEEEINNFVDNHSLQMFYNQQ